MKPFRASTNSIAAVQLSVLALAVIGAFVINWSWTNVFIAVGAYYAYSSAGISMMFHRYWSHKSFEFKWKWLEVPFTLLACLAAKGSPLAWVYVHRLHHANADTEKDPHSPFHGGFRFMGFKNIQLNEIKVFVVRDMLTRMHTKLNDYYLLLIFGWAAALLAVSPTAFYFAWVLPVAVLQFGQDAFNYFAHTHGYRNYETRDQSTNNPWLWPLILGEAWHNNHHGQPAAADFGRKWWEFDPTAGLIRLLQRW